MYICGRPHISSFPHHTIWKYPLTHFHVLTRYRLQQAPRGNTLGACSNESFMGGSINSDDGICMVLEVVFLIVNERA